MMKLVDSGIRITDEEANAITQSIGLGKTMHSTSMVMVHNMLLKLLGEKYGYNWLEVEINPIKNIVYKKEEECEDCDEEISKEDIRIKE